MIYINSKYDYNSLKKDIANLKKRHPFIETGSIGKSLLGRDLFYIRLGIGGKKIFYNGAHHGLEWITSLLLMNFAADYLENLANEQSFNAVDITALYKSRSIYIVPMVNPDGVDYVINGVKQDNPFYEQLLAWNKGNVFSKVWQANARGVDINHNYDAGWQFAKNAEKEYGINGPGPTRFCGEAPESEPETQAMVKFTQMLLFQMVIAFHSQGESIYWNYGNIYPLDSKKIGLLLAKASGYSLETPAGISSYSGYKDWFIKKYRLPGYTVEVGNGENPLPLSQFSEIYSAVLPLMLTAATI